MATAAAEAPAEAAAEAVATEVDLGTMEQLRYPPQAAAAVASAVAPGTGPAAPRASALEAQEAAAAAPVAAAAPWDADAALTLRDEEHAAAQADAAKDKGSLHAFTIADLVRLVGVHGAKHGAEPGGEPPKLYLSLWQQPPEQEARGRLLLVKGTNSDVVRRWATKRHKALGGHDDDALVDLYFHHCEWATTTVRLVGRGGSLVYALVIGETYSRGARGDGRHYEGAYDVDLAGVRAACYEHHFREATLLPAIARALSVASPVQDSAPSPAPSSVPGLTLVHGMGAARFSYAMEAFSLHAKKGNQKDARRAAPFIKGYLDLLRGTRHGPRAFRVAMWMDVPEEVLQARLGKTADDCLSVPNGVLGLGGRALERGVRGAVFMEPHLTGKTQTYTYLPEARERSTARIHALVHSDDTDMAWLPRPPLPDTLEAEAQKFQLPQGGGGFDLNELRAEAMMEPPREEDIDMAAAASELAGAACVQLLAAEAPPHTSGPGAVFFKQQKATVGRTMVALLTKAVAPFAAPMLALQKKQRPRRKAKKRQRKVKLAAPAGVDCNDTKVMPLFHVARDIGVTVSGLSMLCAPLPQALARRVPAEAALLSGGAVRVMRAVMFTFLPGSSAGSHPPPLCMAASPALRGGITTRCCCPAPPLHRCAHARLRTRARPPVRPPTRTQTPSPLPHRRSLVPAVRGHACWSWGLPPTKVLGRQDAEGRGPGCACRSPCGGAGAGLCGFTEPGACAAAAEDVGDVKGCAGAATAPAVGAARRGWHAAVGQCTDRQRCAAGHRQAPANAVCTDQLPSDQPGARPARP